MKLLPVKCSFCGKVYNRKPGRINEAKKFKWNSYCSIACQSNSKNLHVDLVCSRPGCRKIFKRGLNQLRKSSRYYCSLSCAAIVNNSKYIKRPEIVKNCGYCKKDFKGSGKKYCSRTCKEKASIISSEYLLSKIEKFVDRNGRIPLKREFSNYHAIRGRFGTWNNAIKTAGFDPNPVMFANKHVAKDGHECDSFTEKIIDDWMFKNRIKHKRNISYPGNKGFTCDFVVDDKWIEFFGLSGEHKRYDELKKKKLNLAKRYGLDLIKIFPKDIFPENRLGEIFGNRV